MKKIELKKILVPVDFTETSDVAMNEAVSLAKLLNAGVFLLHVVEQNSYRFLAAGQSDVMLPSYEELEKAVKEKLYKIAEKIENTSGIKPGVHVTSGNVPSEVIDFSKGKKMDLIVMGTHGASG